MDQLVTWPRDVPDRRGVSDITLSDGREVLAAVWASIATQVQGRAEGVSAADMRDLSVGRSTRTCLTVR